MYQWCTSFLLYCECLLSSERDLSCQRNDASLFVTDPSHVGCQIPEHHTTVSVYYHSFNTTNHIIFPHIVGAFIALDLGCKFFNSFLRKREILPNNLGKLTLHTTHFPRVCFSQLACRGSHILALFTSLPGAQVISIPLLYKQEISTPSPPKTFN